MSPRVGSEAESGNAASARDTDREPTRPRLAVAPNFGAALKAPTPVDRIGKLTAAELAELSPPRSAGDRAEVRGLQSGAFSKRFGQATLDWSALRTPTPIPPPPAAEHVVVPSAVQPFYGKLPQAPERAELHIADLSLDLANPFVGSSLTPPPQAKRPWLRPLLIALGGCLLIGSGYAGAVYHVERRVESMLAKWTGAEVTPAVAILPDVPLQAATVPTAPVAEHFAQAAEPKPAPVAAPASEADHIAKTAEPSVATATAKQEPGVATAPIERPTAAPAETTPAESSAVASGARARRRAAHSVAERAVATQESAKTVEEAKPEVEPSAAPPAAVTRPALAPNPYVTRSAGAVASSGSAATPTPAQPVAQGPVPQTLTRTQVQTVLESMRAELQTCAAGEHGRMKANVTISGAGRVTYATIEGAFAGTPQGSCMARALRGAQFPQFASPQLRVGYPFAL
jgi:hypothetical protein